MMKLPYIFATLAMSMLLLSCGGGGGSSAPVPLAPMVDSFGVAMPASFDGGDADAAGVDGTAGEGRPIALAPVKVIDSTGRSVSGTTDANGVYHLRIDGFVPPLIATVTRPDGRVWHSPSIKQTAKRGFVYIAITGLTDKIASDVAVAAGKSGASQLTPANIAANLGALQAAKANLNTQLRPLLIAAGLDPATFDPVTTLLITNHLGHDFVLDNTIVTLNPDGTTHVAIKPNCVSITTGLSCN